MKYFPCFDVSEMFGPIKQEDEKFSHQSDRAWQPARSPLIGRLTTDIDWWATAGGIARRRRRHPRVKSSSDETAAELRVDVDRTAEININLDHYLNVSGKMTAALVPWMSRLRRPLQIPAEMNMCAKIQWHRLTAAWPYRSFHFTRKGQLNIPKLKCALHSHFCSAAQSEKPQNKQ